jgi:hypothetical protein
MNKRYNNKIGTINPAMNYPKIVIPAEAGIFSITNRVCKEIPSFDGMTWVCM